MRPVGGALFGWVGDRFGRKQALIWLVLAMAFPSFFIGLLPDTRSIGLAAPILLLVFRLLQGLAVGGERYGLGGVPGRGLGAGTAWVDGELGSDRCYRWSAAGLGGRSNRERHHASGSGDVLRLAHPLHRGTRRWAGGLAIRRHYVQKVPHQAPAKSPLGEAFREHWRTMLHLVCLVAAISVGFYTTFVYAATWLEQVARVAARTALEINTLAMALSVLVLPASGLMSDRLGRRKVLLVTAGALMLLAYPLMALMARGQIAGIIVGQVGLALLVAAVGGLMPATMAELAPWRVRCSVLSVAYNLGLAVLGGITPLIAAWLVVRTGDPRSGGVPDGGGCADVRWRAAVARGAGAQPHEGVSCSVGKAVGQSRISPSSRSDHAKGTAPS